MWGSYGLNKNLCKSLVANNFTEPTEVQKQSLLHLERRSDMLIAAKTGQGKTLCFALPILDTLLTHGLQKKSGQRLRALIISPTRELALQITQHFQNIIPQASPEHGVEKINMATLVGEMSKEKQERLLGYKPSVVVATPGRLWEFISSLENEYLCAELPLIDFLVIDEADRMIEVGHFKELHNILGFVYARRNEKKQVMERKNALKQQGAEPEQFVLKNHKNELKGVDNIEKLKVIEGSVNIDMSKVVDLTLNEDMLNQIEHEEDIQIDSSEDEDEEGEALNPKQKRLLKKEKEAEL